MKNDRYYLKCITAGRAAEGLRADWQEQLKTVQAEIGFEYIRFHGIFHDDMAIYDEDENGEPEFFFGYFDKLFDFLLSVGLKPIFELDGNYEATEYRLSNSNSAFHNWVKMGAPQYPTKKQIEELQAQSKPAITNNFTKKYSLAPHEVVMIKAKSIEG